MINIFGRGNAKSVWVAVHDPAVAACCASLARVWWHASSAFGWTTDRGMEISLRCDSPSFVRDLVVQSVRRWRWRRIEARHPSLVAIHGGIFELLFQVGSCRPDIDAKGAALRCYIEPKSDIYDTPSVVGASFSSSPSSHALATMAPGIGARSSRAQIVLEPQDQATWHWD